jgi:hypothetical protein
MARAQYARPSENKSPSATWSVVSGALLAAFPIANVSDLDPARLIKATGTSLTIRATYGVAQLVKAILIVTHNLAGATVTLTNNGGMASQAITIPTNHEDGMSVNPFKDLSAVAGNSATQWDLAITGAAANIQIGEVLLCADWRTFNPNGNWGLRDDDVHPAVVHRTDGGSRRVRDIDTKWRVLAAEIWPTDTAKAEFLSLARDAHNQVKNWPFVLDADVNDARFLHFTSDKVGAQFEFLDRYIVTVDLEEEGRGLVIT